MSETNSGEKDLHGALFHVHPDPLYVMDTSGRFLDGNAAFEAMTCKRIEQLRGQNGLAFVPEADAERIAGEFARAASGEVRTYEVYGIGDDGVRFEHELTNVPVRGVGGEVLAVLGIARDLAQRVADQRALEVSEQRFRGLFEGAGVGIAIADLEGRYIDANPPYLAMVGYTLDELLETDFWAVTHPDDRGTNAELLDSLLAAEIPAFTFEKRYLTRLDATVWARVSISLIRDAAGEPLHIAATTEDITQVRATEDRLRRSQRLQRLAGQLALVGGWSIEADGGILYWSPEIYRILDAPDGEEPPLEEAVRLYPPEHRVRLEAAIAACLSDGTPFDLEMEIDTYAGNRIPVRTLAEPERDAQGRIVRIVGAFQDITDLRRATVEVQAAARGLTLTLESMTDAFFTLDRDGRFTFVNRHAEQLIGADRHELLGRSLWEQFPELVTSEAYEAYHRAVTTGTTQELAEFRYAPLDLWIDVRAYPSEQGLAVYFQDVADRRAVRLALEEREKALTRQAALLDEAQDAILVRDLEHRITFWNASAERIYGWSAEEALGTSVRELLFDTTETFDAAVTVLLRDGSWSGELTQRTEQGDQVVVTGRWTLVTDDRGAPEAILAINTDITAQQRTEQQLLRAQRMESIGTLAGGIAHDLNNVLAPILLACEMLQTEDRPATESGLLETIATSAQRGADLVTQVLSFARGVEGQRTAVDVVALLDVIRTIVRDTFPKDITFEVDVPASLPEIVGDSTQIQQVLLNLAVNARDAMPDGGTLTVHASRVLLDEQSLAAVPGAEPGDYLLFEVEDTGTGMSPEVRDRVLEPFFTTKPQGAGTGLGLSTSAAVIASHGGFLHVYSEPRKGSRFRVYLPAATAKGSEPPAVSPPGALPRGDGRTVLVVDDEIAIRAMSRQTLETYGYRVLEADNGAEAVATFARHREEIHLVLTDMMMPVMDGPTTIHALREIDPTVIIVGASGLHGNGKVAQAAAAGNTRFIPKPYTSRALLETLAAALTGAGESTIAAD